MTINRSSLRGVAAHALLLPLMLFILVQTASAADSVYVRIHHHSNEPALAASGLADGLTDYGSFQWGTLASSDVDELRASGLIVTAATNPFVVTLGEHSFDPLDSNALSNLFAPYQADPNGDFYLVQFEGPIRSHWLQSLRATGAQVAQPLHPFSYYVWATADQISAARSLGAVRTTVPLLPEWKVQPRLRDFDGKIRATMALASAHVDRRELADQLGLFGQVHAITPLNRHFNVVHMDVPGNEYMQLAELNALYTVQYIPPEVAHRGEMSNQSIVGGISGASIIPGYAGWLTDTGYDGDGVIVGIVDGGIRTTHQDLNDRISPCVPSGDSPTSCTTANNQHGTHVAAAVAGTGNSGITDANGFLRGQGVAPGASVVQQRYNSFIGAGPGGMVPEGMLKIFRESALSGALLTNNSWGPTGTPQGYDIPTQQIDYISRDADPATPGHQPVLAVWSIMNGAGDSGGACAPSSLGSPDEAKNLFGVGSTGLQTGGGAQVPINDVFSVSQNSGHGPACDGRRVPDIVAPGCQTESASSGSDTAFALLCGTSMASPVVSGAIALWAERYIAQTGVNPSPALMKAVFIASALDLVGGTNADGGTLDHRPDRFQGFGRLDLDAVMDADTEVFLYDQETVFTASGQDWSVPMNAADPNEPVIVMLTWTDAPGHGMGGTTPAWVNILDLVVEAGGQTYLGNVIGGDGWSATGGSPDGMNNTEGVYLNPAQHQGALDITVNATDIAGDALDPFNPTDPSQDFALVCYNCIFGDPTFTLSLDPQQTGMCVPDAGTDDFIIDVTVGALGAYSGTVSLSTSGEPAGVSSDLNPDNVVVPGASDWTLTIDDSVSAGTSVIALIGDDGDDIHQRDFTLTLDEPLLGGPALNTPADGASDTSLTPEFSWSALASIDDYQIQVATDSGFGSIVIDETVDGTSFTPGSDLDTGTEYFWRVQGINLCGGGAWSDVFSFTTRLEPVADFSATSFSFIISGGGSDDAELEITNIGTGNLTFEIDLDQPEAIGGVRDQHEPALDEDMLLDNFTLPGGAGSTASGSANGGVTSRGMVVGFTFEGTVAGVSGTGTWASDMIMTMTAPGGTTSFTVGGFSTPHPDWDFQGSGSDNDGTYTSTHIGTDIFGAEGVEDIGTWEFEFEHTWTDAMDWSDITITLHKLPLPVCGEDLTNVDWLNASPTSGSIAQGDSEIVTVTVDGTGLSDGDYLGYLCVATNDPSAALVPMPVELTVTDSPPQFPVAEITPESLSAELGPDQTTVLALNVSNAQGTAALEWDIDTAEADGAPVAPYLAPPGAARGMEQPESSVEAPRIALPRLQGGPISGDFSEGFEDISTLPSAGWAMINNSQPLGSTDWFQGNSASFPAHAGPVDSYISANFTNSSDGGVISNWLLTPEVVLENGTELRFWTRHSTSSTFPDRMQVRLSTSGASTNVGSTAQSVGDFDILLEDINEDMVYPGYPEQWTEFVITVEGLSEPTSGRFGFRYYSPDWDTVGSLIGIDTFSVTQPVEEIGCDFPTNVPWLNVNPDSGTVDAGDNTDVDVTLDSTGLAAGIYEALLCVTTNDPDAALIEVPVTLEVLDIQQADVLLDDLVQTYTGDPLEVSVVTDPPGLAVEVTYDGSTAPPTDAGSYAVVATVTEPGYEGSASDTFLIEPAEADVTLSDLQQQFTGNPLEVTVTTTPAGLNVIVTYDGSTTPPSAIGEYAVEATIDEPNYTGSAAGTFRIVGDDIFWDRFELDGQ